MKKFVWVLFCVSLLVSLCIVGVSAKADVTAVCISGGESKPYLPGYTFVTSWNESYKFVDFINPIAEDRNNQGKTFKQIKCEYQVFKSNIKKNDIIVGIGNRLPIQRQGQLFEVNDIHSRKDYYASSSYVEKSLTNTLTASLSGELGLSSNDIIDANLTATLENSLQYNWKTIFTSFYAQEFEYTTTIKTTYESIYPEGIFTVYYTSDGYKYKIILTKITTRMVKSEKVNKLKNIWDWVPVGSETVTKKNDVLYEGYEPLDKIYETRVKQFKTRAAYNDFLIQNGTNKVIENYVY